MEFKEGDLVVYIPDHANGDIYHHNSQLGFIHSVKARCCFVKYYQYDSNDNFFIQIGEPIATYKRHLVKFPLREGDQVILKYF